MLIIRGSKPWIQITVIRPFALRLVLLSLASVPRPHFELVCSARQPNDISKSQLRASFDANNNWLNCARIANVCRMREVCEKNRVG